MSMADVLEREDTKITDSGDHDVFSHFIKKTSFDDVWLNGSEVEALCGKRWVPTKDPKNYPVCPTCKDIYDGMPDERPEGDK